jgi:hypothetical protein
MISPWDFAERDQIAWVKLQLRIKMEWFDMMDLEYSFVTTGSASRLAE